MNSNASKSKFEEGDETDDAISIPLYLSGLVVSLLGIIAVNSALSDPQFGSTTLTLTVLGFVFSVACRWLRIKLRALEILGVCILGFFAYRFLTHSFNPSVFVPPETTQGDLIMAIVLEWLTVVRAWMLLNDESVVFTSVTSIAMIGLVGASNINTELLIYFFVYMIFATFLLLHQTYLVRRSWTAAGVRERAEAGVVKTQAALSVLSGVIALMIGMVVVVPLREIGSHLSLGNAMKSFVGNQHGTDAVGDDGDSLVALSDDATFKVGTGDGSSATNLVVMRVKASDNNEHYYRGRTYDVYEGNEWLTSVAFDHAGLRTGLLPPFGLVNTLPGPSDPGGDHTEPQMDTALPMHQFATRFTVVSSSSQTLYVPYGTQDIDLLGAALQIDQSSDNHLQLSSAMTTGFGYKTFSLNTEATPQQLQHAPPLLGHCPTALFREYVDQRGNDVVSSDDQFRLFQTAERIVASLPQDRKTDFDKAEAIREWVSRRAVYSLDVNAVPTNDDAVSYFLFDSRKGYCDLFASSMAILCRYAGIPARVATGFGPGVQNDRGGFDLRERDKHAWVEVWFPEYGWQEFDPTEGAIQDSTITGAGFGPGWIKQELQSFRKLLAGGTYSLILAVLVLTALIYVAKVEVYDRFFGRKKESPLNTTHKSLAQAIKHSDVAAGEYSRITARGRYATFESIVRRMGITRRVSETPVEFMVLVKERLQRFGPPNSDVGTVVAAADTLTQLVMMASYAPLELVSDELVAAEQNGTGEVALNRISEYEKTHASAMRNAAKIEALH
jgi:hypothetical protein